MKSDKFILASLSLLMFPLLCFGQAKVGVDKKIELLGAVYAAAQVGDNPQIRYTELMEEWLPYQERDDEAVAFVREMIENNGLTYSDLIAVSPYITLDGSRISGKLPKDGNGPESVWNENNFKKFVKLMDTFYRNHRDGFENYLKANEETYATAIENVSRTADRIDFAWFGYFFGTRKDITIYITANGKEDNVIYSEPAYFTDKDGISVVISVYPSAPLYECLLHEICHPYVARLDGFWPQAEKAMEKIFNAEEWKGIYSDARYPSAKSLYEDWLTELAVAMYVKDHPLSEKDIPYMLMMDRLRGLFWMERSIGFTDNFSESRSMYGCFGDFMPRLCEFLDFSVLDDDNFSRLVEESRIQAPYITYVYPVPGTDLAGYKALDYIEIRFSEPMFTNSVDMMPDEDFVIHSYWKDEMTYIILLDSNFDYGNREEYTITVPKMLQSKKAVSMEKDYEIKYYFL